jgi:ATP-binding cassette subfamily B (MDR/TAP) protein 1
MKQVQEEMDRDNQINYNLLTVYKNAQGCYLMIFLGFITAVIRGMELPALSLVFNYVFKALVLYQTAPDLMVYQLVMAMIMFIGIGVGVSLFQLLSSIFFAIASETLTLKLRVLAFRNILYQDAAYFDNPQNTAGKLITRLASDAPNIKAIVDSRMMQVIYGLTTLLVCTIIAFIYSWQIAIPGLGMTLILGITTAILARIVQKRNLALARNDDAGKVREDGSD